MDPKNAAPGPPAQHRSAAVLLRGERIGLLEEIAGGTRFTYDPAWLAQKSAEAISPTLPLRPEPYRSQGLHPFFANLLPEGWYLDIVQRTLQLDKSDPFGLLLGTCTETIGAVTVVPQGEEAGPPRRGTG